MSRERWRVTKTFQIAQVATLALAATLAGAPTFAAVASERAELTGKFVPMTGKMVDKEDFKGKWTLQKPGHAFRDCLECPEMVVVPTGSFMMGSFLYVTGRGDTDSPLHRVTIARAFPAGKYEVTLSE